MAGIWNDFQGEFLKNGRSCVVVSLVASAAFWSCAEDKHESNRTLSDQSATESIENSQFGLENSTSALPISTVMREFTFTIGADGTCNRNCLSLVVNNSDTYDLGCNKPSPSCNLPSRGIPQKNLKLRVFDKADNVFRLIMSSADPANNPRARKPKVVFDTSDKQMVADVDYHINTFTPSSIDFWINDNGDSDYKDFHGILTAPANTRFVVENFTPTVYPLSADRTIDACKDLGTGPEICQWRYNYEDTCRQNKCSKLLIYFAGGEMGCPDPVSKPQSYLARYAKSGYVAVCARIFETQVAAGQFPLNREAARVDLLVKTITSDPAIRQGWNGERLLISGVSHGATAAAIAMARNDFDSSQAHWQGSKKTGVCLFDGIYDTRDLLTRAFDNTCSIYQRGYTRYEGRNCTWSGNSKIPSTWPHPDTCRSPDLALDTIVGVDVRRFAINNWKLIECGSKMDDFCDKDMVADLPQRQLCNQISADKGKSCEFASFPSLSHHDCGAEPGTQNECLNWFDQL